MADMLELIARLEAAEAGSRELDEAVWLACGQERQITGPVNNGIGVWNGPHVSHSLDAALALAERVLPGWEIVTRCLRDGGMAKVSNGPVEHLGASISSGSVGSAALALCIAILKAKAQGEGG